MAKTRQHLETEGYKDFFHFGDKYLGLWLTLMICLLITAFFAYGPLLDPAFKPPWSQDFHCHRKGCVWVRLGAWALAFFLTLPVWLKFTTAAFLGSGGLAGSIQRIVRALDGKPDIAVGPNGLYFPGKTSYHSLDWNEVSKLTIVRYRSKKGLLAAPAIKLFGQLPTDIPKYPIWPIVEPLLYTVSPTFGFNQFAVIDSIRRHAPMIVISEVEEFVG